MIRKGQLLKHFQFCRILPQPIPVRDSPFRHPLQFYSSVPFNDSTSLEELIQSNFEGGDFKKAFDLIQMHNSKLPPHEYGQVSISLPEVQESIIKLIEENQLQEAIRLWKAVQTWETWAFSPSKKSNLIAIRSLPTHTTSVYDLSNYASFLHLMTISLMKKPHRDHSMYQSKSISEAPLKIAHAFCHDIFLEYSRNSGEDSYPKPFPATFEILVRWLVLQGYFELSSKILLEMQRLNVVPRESLVRHTVDSWSRSSLSISQGLADICVVYSEVSLPPDLTTLKLLKDFVLNSLSKGRVSEDTHGVALSKLLTALSNGYLRLKHPSIALKLLSLIPVPTQPLLEKNYIDLLKYYGHATETADLDHFERISDQLLSLPLVEPTQDPNRAYKVGYSGKLDTAMLPKYKYPLSKELVHAIVAGYGYNQEVESVAQLLQLTVSGGFPGVELDDQMMMSVMDGFARHSNIPALQFLRSFWRKNLPLSHPWMPELSMIDALAYNRHLDPLPDIMKSLLDSTERSQELLAMPCQDPALHLYGFGRKLYQHVGSFSPDVAAEIAEVLITHGNGTPPELWEGWVRGLKEDTNITPQQIEKAQSMYCFNGAHSKYPAFKLD